MAVYSRLRGQAGQRDSLATSYSQASDLQELTGYCASKQHEAASGIGVRTLTKQPRDDLGRGCQIGDDVVGPGGLFGAGL